jgi:hypothetical protein
MMFRFVNTGILAVSLSFGSLAFAGDAGCGLGSMIWSKNTKLGQLFAVTTNSSTGTQTLGITSGTSGCSAKGLVYVDTEQIKFAEANFSQLKNDVAAGEGEYLTAFGGLLGCSSALNVAQKLHQDYNLLVVSPDTTPVEFLSNIQTQLRGDAQFSEGCTRI